MNSIAVAMFLLLTAIAALHLLWGFGLRWPAHSDRELVAMVVGRTGQTRMPTPLQCAVAATAIFVAGLCALAVTDLVVLPVNSAIVTAVGVVATLVFAARGVAAYSPGWRARFSQEPFATLDRTKYGPLCLLFAAGFAALLIKRIGS